MKTLPNGVKIFNATPHTIRFWEEGWGKPVEIESDEVISATIEEEIVEERQVVIEVDAQVVWAKPVITFVHTNFVGSEAGEAIARHALVSGADVVVGSIIAAQAYPGLVVAMTPAPGYERVPPTEKRMHPGKFTTFGG